MAVLDVTFRPSVRFADKEHLRNSINEHDVRTGFIPIPDATAEMAQEASAETLRRAGLDPETSNEASHAVVEMREE